MIVTIPMLSGATAGAQSAAVELIGEKIRLHLTETNAGAGSGVYLYVDVSINGTAWTQLFSGFNGYTNGDYELAGPPEGTTMKYVRLRTTGSAGGTVYATLTAFE